MILPTYQQFAQAVATSGIDEEGLVELLGNGETLPQRRATVRTWRMLAKDKTHQGDQIPWASMIRWYNNVVTTSKDWRKTCRCGCGQPIPTTSRALYASPLCRKRESRSGTSNNPPVST